MQVTKLTHILAVGALAVLMGGGVVATMPTATVAQAATSRAKKQAQAKKKRAQAKKKQARAKKKQAQAKKRAQAAKKKLQAEKAHFTADEWAQIQAYRNQAHQIGNSTKGIYAQKPVLKAPFNPGKLSRSYIDRTVNWINFYRTMFGLSKITDDADWDTSAQYGAATTAAADQGISHNLEGITRPSFVSASDWQLGAEATNESNLFEGLKDSYNIITGYLNDSSDATGMNPGHRSWILGGISQVGVGQSGEYNVLRVFDRENYNPGSVGTLAFPKAGLMPYDLVRDGAPWSISYADDYSGNAPKPNVSVFDKTTNKQVKVTQVTTDDGYGNYGTTVYFLPKQGQVKVNHSYTVKISQIQGQADVAYQTKLFDLKMS